MAKLLDWLGNTLGSAVDAILPGDQSFLHQAPAPPPPVSTAARSTAANIGAGLGVGPSVPSVPYSAPMAAPNPTTPGFQLPSYKTNTPADLIDTINSMARVGPKYQAPIAKPDFAVGGSSEQSNGVQGTLQALGQIPFVGIPVQIGNQVVDMENRQFAGENVNPLTEATKTGVSLSPLGQAAQLFGGVANEATKALGINDGTTPAEANPLFGPTEAYSNQVQDQGLGRTALNTAFEVLGSAVPGAGPRPLREVGPTVGDAAAAARDANAAVGQKGFLAGPKATGFVQDTAIKAPDKMPRMEVSDSEAAINRAALDKMNSTAVGKFKAPLSDVLGHPALYEKYPELANTPVVTRHLPGAGSMASFDTEKGIIAVDPLKLGDSKAALKTTLLHEIQHAIQTKEGFAPGGNFNAIYGNLQGQRAKLLGQVDVINTQLRNEATKSRWDMRPDSTSSPAYQALLDKRQAVVDKILKLEGKWGGGVGLKENAHSQYSRTAGEAEARAVSARQNFAQHELDSGQYDLMGGKITRPIPGKNNPYATDFTGVNPKQLIVKPAIKSGAKVTQGLDYGMSHRPTETGATADDISQAKSEMGVPKDFYDHPEYYSNPRELSDRESLAVLQAVRGKPDAEVTIYRAGPKNELNKGDWVTLSKTYAKNESLTEGTKVNSFKVKASDIQFAGDSINEFGYYPKKALGESGAANLGAEFGLDDKAKASLARLDKTEAETEKLLAKDGVKVSPKSTVKAMKGGGAETPPTPPKALKATPELPAGRKQSKFTKTASESPEVSAPVQKAIKDNPATYKTTSNEEHLAASATFLKGQKTLEKARANISERLDMPTKRVDDQTVSDAIATAKALDERGKAADLQSATDIYNKLAEHLSKKGQEIQAASLLSNRTPQGLQYGALKAFRKAGIEVTPEIQATVKKLVDDVKTTKAGTDERQLATAKLVKYVNNKLPRSKLDAATGIWRAGLLTGPETATKVAFSHAITLPFETAAQLPTALADRAISLITHKRATSATLRGTGEGVKQGAKDFIFKMKTGIDAPNSGGELPDFGSGTRQTAYEKFVGNLHGGLFKPAYEGRFMQSLNDQALTEARNQNLTGAKKEAFIKDFVENPTDKAKATASFDAARATNQQETDLGKLATQLQHVKIAGFPVGKILAPFARIPSAIGTVGMVDYTPLGIGREVIQQIRAGHFDQRLMSQAIGRSTTGTATAGLGAALMMHGRMTLKAPDDKKDRSLWTLQGKQANSIYMGGTVTKRPDGTYNYQGGNWVSLNAFGAIGIVTGIGGAMGRALATNKGDIVKATPEALASGARLLLDQPYFKGASGALNALNDPTRYAQTFMDNTIGSIIPTGIQQTARGFDPFQRSYPTSIPDTLKAGVPGLRETLPEQKDLYGTSIPSTGTDLLHSLDGVINPFYPQQARNQSDSVTTELQRLYNNLGSSTSPNIALPGKNLTINGQKMSMTPEQLNQYIAGSGPLLKQGISNLIANPTYQSLTDEQKANEINKVITAAHGVQQIDQFGDKPKSLTGTEKQMMADPSAVGEQKITPKTTGSGTTTTSTTKTPQERYQAALDKYNQGVKDGTLTGSQLFLAQQSLGKQAITSKYSQPVLDLYGMSKAQRTTAIAQDPSLQALMPQVQQLSTELAQNFATSNDKIASQSGTTKKTSSGRKTSSSSGRKIRMNVSTRSLVSSSNSAFKKLMSGTSFKAPKVKVAKVPKTRRKIA